jgi:hypothetical protein
MGKGASEPEGPLSVYGSIAQARLLLVASEGPSLGDTHVILAQTRVILAQSQRLPNEGRRGKVRCDAVQVARDLRSGTACSELLHLASVAAESCMELLVVNVPAAS